jgi:hypothetical protein
MHRHGRGVDDENLQLILVETPILCGGKNAFESEGLTGSELFRERSVDAVVTWSGKHERRP